MSDIAPAGPARVRTTRIEDFSQIDEIARRTYGLGWPARCLLSHREIFPAGQMVAVPADDDHRVLGFAACLIILWDEYDADESWHDYTDRGMFTNHDPEGHTLYGAEVVVDPAVRRLGVGTALYSARRALARRLGLWRIRAHSRLAGYAGYADRMSPEDYVRSVIAGKLMDPTLSFQLRQGFRVLGVASDYLDHDGEHSMGHAALIEWINEEAVPAEVLARRREWS